MEKATAVTSSGIFNLLPSLTYVLVSKLIVVLGNSRGGQKKKTDDKSDKFKEKEEKKEVKTLLLRATLSTHCILSISFSPLLFASSSLEILPDGMSLF